jgi:uncharacterized secreted protein with C-terminal beta-propeller domain
MASEGEDMHLSGKPSLSPTGYKKRRGIALVIASLAVIACFSLSVKIWHQKSSTASMLPANIVRTAPFPVLFYSSTIPDNFRLISESVKYNSGYLFFQLSNTNKSQTITVTEQALPSNLATSTIIGKEKVDGTDNNTTISFDGSRMIGYVISKDRNTFVVMNAANGTELDTFKDLLRLLSPV